MRKALLLLFFCCSSLLGFSTTWYSLPAGGGAQALASWWSTNAGTGLNPTTFAAATDTFIVQSNMTVSGTNWDLGGTLLFNSGNLIKGGTGATTLNIGRHLVLNNATFISAGASTGSVVINLGGNLMLNGTSYISNGASLTYNRINFNNTASTLTSPQTMSWASTGVSSFTNVFINAGCTVQLLTNIPFPNATDTGMTVLGSLVCGTNVISSGSSSKFTLAAGGTLYTGHASGINGSIASMAATNFSQAANYVYNGFVAQVTGTSLPASIALGGSVMINNLAGVTVSQNTVFATGATLKLAKGLLTNTATNIAMSAGANVYRDSGLIVTTPSVYNNVNLTYNNLGYNAPAVTTSLEFPNTFSGTVTVNKPGAVIILNASRTVTGDLNITSGGLDVSAANFALSVGGNWTNNSPDATPFFQRAGTVTFGGTVGQLLGGTVATSFYNLTINNATGVILLKDEVVNNTLTLTSGRISLGAFNLIMGAASSAIAGTLSASNMIVANGAGTLRKLSNTFGTYLFPIGDNTNYTPIKLAFTAGTYGAGAYAAANVTPLKQPNNANVNNYLLRYWSVSLNAITAPIYSLTATYVPADVYGTEASISTGKYFSATLPLPSWLKYTVTNTATHTLSATGLTTAGDVTGITTAPPTVTATGGTTICAFTGSAPISVSGATGDGPYQYSWSPAASLSASTGLIVVASPVTTTTYTVTITDGNGFTNTGTVTVLVNPSPNAITAAIGGGRICQGTNVSFSNTFPGGTWSSANTLIAGVGVTSGLVSGLNVGTATISYILTSTGCYTTTVVTVNIAPIAITGPSEVCVGSTITLADSVHYGVFSTSASGTATVHVDSGIVTGVAAGTVTIGYFTGAGCGGVSKVVTVNPLPALITGTMNVCVGATTTLANTSTGGTWTSFEPATAKADTNTGVIHGLSLGTTTITYTLPTGCLRTTAYTVNALAPIVGPDSICAGANVFLTNIIGGGTWVSSNPAIASADVSTGHIVGLDSGISYVLYILPTGCTASRLMHIIPALPPIMGSSHVCTGSVITLSNAKTGGTWSSDNAFVAGIGGTSGVLSGLSTDTVHITYIKPYYCKATKVITVTPLPDPIVTYSSLTNSLQTNSYYATYQWYGKDHGLIPGANGFMMILPTYTDSFYVSVTDTNGCSSSTLHKYYSNVGVNNYTLADFSVYPNPTSGSLNIIAPVTVRAIVSKIDGTKELELTDAKTIDITSLAPGMYIVALYNNAGEIVLVKKVIRQ